MVIAATTLEATAYSINIVYGVKIDPAEGTAGVLDASGHQTFQQGGTAGKMVVSHR